jgi:uncharacterized protein YjdB
LEWEGITLNILTGELTISGEISSVYYGNVLPPWYNVRSAINSLTIADTTTTLSLYDDVFINTQIKTLYLGRNTYLSSSSPPSLEQVTIGTNVTTIYENTFKNNTALKRVYNLALTPQSIDGTVFSGVTTSEVDLYVPMASVDLYKAAAFWKSFNVLGILPATSVSLNKTTATLAPNATLQLTATITPSTATNQNLLWTSSNTGVATVDNTGKVTAVGIGAATITATTLDGSNKTATCVVTVKAVVAVTGVSLDETTLSLATNATQQLTATVAPSYAANKAVSWGSSSTSVATVSSAGLVTAVSVGTATITVTTEDGSRTATCAVTVTAAVISVTGVSLDKTTLSLALNATQQLTATVSPADAANKAVTWSSSNTSIATVSSTGLVKAVAAGTATITVTTQNGNKTATCTVTVSKAGNNDNNNGDNPTTAVETRHAASLQSYPNPTTGVVYIDNSDGAKVEVYNTQGVLVETRHAASLQSSGSATLDITHLPAGVYIIRVGGKTAKVVKR